jgi:outer membrane receptor protein involved in Fe transport
VPLLHCLRSSVRAWLLSAALLSVFAEAVHAQADASTPQVADAGVPLDAGQASTPADVGASVDAGPAAASTPVAPVSAAPAPLATAPVTDSHARGTLRGTVVSADDEGPIAGARVYVRGAEFDAETDGSGAFSLSLPYGTHQISIIAAGFSTQTVSKVEVRAQPLELNVKLPSGSVALDEMVVVGSRVKGGIATLIAERRESKAVADVIGAEQMARSGDSNAAAALSRVTGITVIDGRWVIVRGMGERYSTLTLNGLQVASPDPTRRVVPLDIFPAGFIDSVVVQKSYTPDLPGEFGGGLVQLRSRDYPHDFVFNVNVAAGGNANAVFQDNVSYSGGKTDFLGIDDGDRALPKQFDDPRGKLVVENVLNEGKGYSEEEITGLSKLLPRKYNTHNETTLPDFTFGANIGNEWRLRRAKIGFVAGVGYRNEFRAVLDALVVERAAEVRSYNLDVYQRQISLSSFLDWGVEFSANQKLKVTTMLLRQTDNSVQQRRDLENADRRTILQWVERQVLLQQVSGKHKFAALRDFQVDWRYAFGMATRDQPSQRTYEYQLENEEYAYKPNSGTNSVAFGDLKDKTHEGALDLGQPFKVRQRLEAKIKAGALIYRRDRDSAQRSFEYLVPNEGVNRVAPPNTVLNPDLYGTDPNQIDFQETTTTTDSYAGWSQIEAGYGNLDLPLHRTLDVSGGARFEHARIHVDTFDPFAPTVKGAPADLDNKDLLPSAGLTWRFIEDFQARLGYSRTLNRPDFRELSSSRYFDLENNMRYEGNPMVKRALIENFDARLEWYYRPDEVFSIGGFVKRFNDPIETKQVAAQEVIYSIQNVDKAISYGLELEGRKRFGFIAKVLRPLYVASNVSLIKSEVKVPLKDDKVHTRPLQGQSPWVVNAQLGWDDTDEGGTGTAASLLYNVAGKRIRIVGDIDQASPDTYELPVHRLDFVVSQNLPHKLKIGARVRNILNSEQVWKEDDDVTRRFRRGADFQISLAWSY